VDANRDLALGLGATGRGFEDEGTEHARTGQDSMIAATALTHGLTVATHNVRDFQKADVAVLDPFI